MSLLLGLLLAAVPPAGAEPSITFRRGPEAHEDVRRWFSTLDRLLDESDAATARLVQDAARPTAASAARAAKDVESLAALYGRLARDAEGESAVKAAAGRVLSAAGKDSSASLSEETARSVYSLEAGSLNRWIRLIRQKALGLRGPPGRWTANSLITVGAGDGAAELALLDVSGRPSVEKGRAVSPALRALVDAARIGELRGDFVLGWRRLWIRRLGAELYADLAASSGDSIVRIRYREPGGTAIDQSRFYFFTKVLYDLGFAVSVDRGELVAALGGEAASLGPYRRGELFVAAWNALETSARMRPGLKIYLAGSVSQEENARRLDKLAGVFAAEGGLPFFSDARPASLSEGLGEYLARDAAREQLRARMDKTLARLGLGGFPAGVGVGQRTIGLHFNGPIEAAIARGALKSSKTEYARVRSYDPLAGLLSKTAGKALPVSRLGVVLDHAGAIALVGARTAFRAQWRLDAKTWLVLRLLRGPDGAISHFDARRVGLDRGPQPLDRKKAVADLERLGLLSAEGGAHLSSPVSPASAGKGDVFLARALHAVSASPFTARITYDPAKAVLGDRIFVTPYLGPGDGKAARRSRGLLTTAGGPQAAILAARAGVPAFNLPRAHWSDSSGLSLEQPVFGPVKTRGGRRVVPVERTVRRVLREGEAVRLDPARGTVTLLDEERQGMLVRLEEALRAYDRSGDVQAVALWAAGQLAASGLGPELKKELGDALIGEMERRLKTGAPRAHVDRIRRVVKKGL